MYEQVQIRSRYRREARWDVIGHSMMVLGASFNYDFKLDEEKEKQTPISFHYLTNEYLLKTPTLRKILNHKEDEDIIVGFLSDKEDFYFNDDNTKNWFELIKGEQSAPK